MKLVRGCVGWILLDVALLIILVITGYVWFRLNYVEPYIAFRTKEREVVSQLDALNDKVAQTLPQLPPGASESKRWSVGIVNPIYDHGRWLIISISTTMNAEDISAYYRQNLLEAGWNEYTGTYSRSFDLYYRGTSCLEIHLLTQTLHAYDMTIWHDFRSQPFIPPLPNRDYMEFAELGETKFATCPPDN
jgi:hypothetical protein